VNPVLCLGGAISPKKLKPLHFGKRFLEAPELDISEFLTTTQNICPNSIAHHGKRSCGEQEILIRNLPSWQEKS
jgi:hypothetical protein